MKAKRNKAYKKTLALFTTAFKFREPYQIIVDAEFVKAIARQRIDLVARLEDIFGGTVKPMITQCSISHLYKAGPEGQSAVDLAKSFERRRCNHWQVKETDAECIAGIMGDVNRFNYCVATQSPALRRGLRNVPGVPLVFEKRAIILLEPPSEASVGKRKEIEESKLHVPTSELANLRPASSTSRAPLSSPSDPTASKASTDPIEAAAPTTSAYEATTSLPPATRATAASGQMTAEAMLARAHAQSNKRKRAKEPNPLSVKKKKGEKPASVKMGDKADGLGKGRAKENRTGKGKGKDAAGGGERAKSKAGGSSSTAVGAAKPKEKRDNTRAAQTSADSPAPTPTSAAAADGTKGVTRTMGDGTSKKALKRKRKREQEQATGTADGTQAKQ